jgi:hypothetical protein
MNISFKHDYHKLEKDEFTTIRGVTYAKKLRENQKVGISTPSGYFSAVVEQIVVVKIEDIRLELLKEDGEFPGFVLNTHSDFVDLINTFRARYMPKATLSTIMAVIYLRKCP